MTEGDLREELSWKPERTGPALPPASDFVVGGMGGSALPGHAVRFLDPAIPVSVHRDYGVPEYAPRETLYIAISYSGETAETLSFAQTVLERGLPLAVISSGGTLLALAREKGLPYVQVPGGRQPRLALLLQTRALLALLGQEVLLLNLAHAKIDANALHQEAEALAHGIRDGIPLFYASRTNGFLAHYFKILVNESAKMPAHVNVFPELNHNEMQAYGAAAPEFASLARFVLLRDPNDDERIIRRMDAFRDLMREQGRSVFELPPLDGDRSGALASARLFGAVLTETLAKLRNVDADAVPLIEEFKKRI